MTTVITDSNYDEIVATDKLVVIDFWAQWCGPCKTLSVTIDALAEEYADRVVVGKVDVDDNADIVDKFNIRNVPTVLFVKNGQVIDKAVGAVLKPNLVSIIEANI